MNLAFCLPDSTTKKDKARERKREEKAKKKDTGKKVYT